MVDPVEYVSQIAQGPRIKMRHRTLLQVYCLPSPESDE
jgi:hypothetical protein